MRTSAEGRRAAACCCCVCVAALLLLLAAAPLASAAPEAPATVSAASLESLVPSGFAAAAQKAIAAYSSALKEAREKLGEDGGARDMFSQALPALAAGSSSLQGTPFAGLISLMVGELCPMFK